MKNNKEIERARTEAVATLVKWAKTRVGYFPMRSAVNNYMETTGVNRLPMNGEEGLIAHRKIAAQGLAIECISRLNSEQFSRVDRKLDCIVNDISRQQSRGMKL